MARKRAILVPPHRIPPGNVLRWSGPSASPLSGSSGTITVECAACAGVLARRLRRHEVMNVVVECPRCGRYNLVRT